VEISFDIALFINLGSYPPPFPNFYAILEYLITILSALGIAPNSTLVTIHQLLTVEQEEYAQLNTTPSSVES